VLCYHWLPVRNSLHHLLEWSAVVVASVNITDRMAGELTDLVLDLNGSMAELRIQITSQLRLLEVEVSREVLRLDLESFGVSFARARRLERFLVELPSFLDYRYTILLRKLQKGLREIPRKTQAGLRSRTLGIFSVHILRTAVKAIKLRALADHDTPLGESVEDWMKGQQEALRRRIVRQLRLGVMQSDTNSELIHRLRGSSTGRTIEIQLTKGKSRRIKEYSGGLFDLVRRHADTLVRTASMSAFNQTLVSVYRSNSLTIKGFESWVLMDHKGSSAAVCMARAGSAWSLDGKPLPESVVQERFPGAAPWHFLCHTTFIPVFKSWDELESNRSLKKIPKSVRSRMTGETTTNIGRSFDDWLRLQGEDVARKKLGSARYELWKSGRITTTQLIDTAGNPLNAQQLQNVG
jgi:hypothetical protein